MLKELCLKSNNSVQFKFIPMDYRKLSPTKQSLIDIEDDHHHRRTLLAAKERENKGLLNASLACVPTQTLHITLLNNIFYLCIKQKRKTLTPSTIHAEENGEARATPSPPPPPVKTLNTKIYKVYIYIYNKHDGKSSPTEDLLRLGIPRFFFFSVF